VYVELGGDYYDQRNKPKIVSRLVKRLAQLGYSVDLKPVVSELPSVSDSAAPAPQSAPQQSVSDFFPSSPPDTSPIAAKRKRGRPCKCREPWNYLQTYPRH
jgi:hypothetical protein